jgi:hypothetical protein
LESVRGVTATAGSNPALSASLRCAAKKAALLAGA